MRIVFIIHAVIYRVKYKTFYEFLVADLVLKYLIKAIDELDALRNSKRRDSYQRAIEDPNHFEKQYYTTLMNAYLCAEPEIIEMIVEWKENVINGCFQGERSDYDVVIEELFDKQIEMLSNSIFMPRIWNGETNDNVIKKSYMQYCATYFMNLLILQATTKEDSICLIKEGDWKYISQFWKMNIQEDVLLKFISLFSIKNKPEGICIRKKQVSGKTEQKNLLEKQMDIFHFLQDDITYTLYGLHDVEKQYCEKQSNRKKLKGNGINIDFELLVEELKEYCILRKPLRFIEIRKHMQEGLDILERIRVDASLVFEWLLCINHYLDKVSYPLRRRERISYELAIMILHFYPKNIELISEAFKCCRKMGGTDLLFRNNYLLKIIDTIAAYGDPQLFLEYFDLLDFSMIQETEKIVEILKEILHRKQFQSLDLIVAVLKKFYMTSAEYEVTVLLNEIIRNTNEIYDSSPEAIIDILRLCTLKGMTDEAYYLAKIVFSKFELLFSKQPELAISFLDILYNNKDMRHYFQEAVHIIEQKFDEIVNKNPKIIISLSKINLLSDPYYYKELIAYFYKKYDILFNTEQEKAIEFLKTSKKFIGEKELRKALHYSLNRFNNLIIKSPTAAADLLIACKGEDLDKCHHIQIFFNYILYKNLPVDTQKIFELFESLDYYELEKMWDFFKERYIYIVINFPDLAEKIATVYYCMPCRREFIQALSNCKCHYFVEEEYISRLEKIWHTGHYPISSSLAKK